MTPWQKRIDAEIKAESKQNSERFGRGIVTPRKTARKPVLSFKGPEMKEVMGRRGTKRLDRSLDKLFKT